MGIMKRRARESDGRFAKGEEHRECGAVVHAATASSRARRPRVPKVKPLKDFELSVTVSVGGEDIIVKLLDRLEEYLKNETVAGKFSAERGGAAYHLHFQGVVRVRAESIIAVSKRIKRYLGWDTACPAGGVVMCRSLRHVGLHTFHGLLGYCMKDFDKPHFQTIDHNIKGGDIQQGVEEYARYGAEDKRTRVCLTTKNTYERMAMFWRFNARHPAVADSERLLYEMVRCGKFYPSMAWIIGSQGRGVDQARSDALLTAMVMPHLISKAGIRLLFFTAGEQALGNGQPRSEWFLSRWAENEEKAEEIRRGKLKVDEGAGDVLEDFAEISNRVQKRWKEARMLESGSTSNAVAMEDEDLMCEEDFKSMLGALEIPLYNRCKPALCAV